MMIGIDMAHTLLGKGMGAKGILSETCVNREVGKLIIKYLEEVGEDVINCTIDKSDNDLYDRITIANRYPLDLFLSIHLNIGKENGTETYILDYDGKSEVYARRIQEAVYKSCSFKDRGIKTGDFYELQNTKAPAVMIKLFFINSKEDVKRYNSFKIAQEIVRSITGKEVLKEVYVKSKIYRKDKINKINITEDIIPKFKGYNFNAKFMGEGIIFESQYMSLEEAEILREHLGDIFGEICFR